MRAPKGDGRPEALGESRPAKSDKAVDADCETAKNSVSPWVGSISTNDLKVICSSGVSRST